MTNRFLSCAMILLLLTVNVIAQSGGQFTIEKSVIATGGQQSAGGQFAVAGTTGQQAAGERLNNSPFLQTTGFWTPDQFAPTSAGVIVSGRIQTADGRGIRNVIVSMTNTNGETRTVITSAFGYFIFTDVPVGETYIFSVSAKRYRFSEPTQVRAILEETGEMIFVAAVEAQRANKGVD